MGKESVTIMTMHCPDGDDKIFGDPYMDAGGQGHVRPLRQLVFKKTDGSASSSRLFTGSGGGALSYARPRKLRNVTPRPTLRGSSRIT
jgi:hypothetical protein